MKGQNGRNEDGQELGTSALGRVTPFIEGFLPFAAEASFQARVEVLKRVLFVTAQGVHVFLKRRFKGAEVWQVEGLVDFADLAHRIEFQIFESDFAVVSSRNSRAIFEKGLVHFAVLADEPVV